MYDFIYLIADQLVKKCNPCNIQISRSGLATCDGWLITLCCDGCDHLSIKGCTTKALGCKLAFCEESCTTIDKKCPDLHLKLDKLKMVMCEIDDSVPGTFRLSRESYFQRLKLDYLEGLSKCGGE